MRDVCVERLSSISTISPNLPNVHSSQKLWVWRKFPWFELQSRPDRSHFIIHVTPQKRYYLWVILHHCRRPSSDFFIWFLWIRAFGALANPDFSIWRGMWDEENRFPWFSASLNNAWSMQKMCLKSHRLYVWISKLKTLRKSTIKFNTLHLLLRVIKIFRPSTWTLRITLSLTDISITLLHLCLNTTHSHSIALIRFDMWTSGF